MKTSSDFGVPPTPALAIAVVDDVPEIRDLARGWLAAAGHDVSCAANGREFAALAESKHFDLVITDVMMPESDGLDVIAALKKSSPQTRIVAISGGGIAMGSTDCLRVALRLGACAILAKPFSRAQLLLVLKQATTSVACAAS